MCIKQIKSFFCMLILVITFLASCSTLSVRVDNKVEKLQGSTKVIYFKNSFLDRDFPTFPLINAAVYRNISNENLDKFKEIENICSEQIATFCAEIIRQKTRNEVQIIKPSFKLNNLDELDNITEEIEKRIAAECRAVGASYAFIPIMRVSVGEISLIEKTAKNLFESKVYVCNKDGKIIGKGYISTNEEWVSGRDTTTYHILIKAGEPLFKQCIEKLF